MPWDDDLEGAALNIAGLEVNSLRVMAGPGTGKSFAMKRRVQRLLEEGVDPRTILACTFTRTVAADMRKDLEELGVEGASQIKTSTIHSLCFSILMREQALVATGRVPRPMLGFETQFMLTDLDDPRFGGLRARRKRLLAFNAAWARLQSQDPGWPDDEVDRAFGALLIYWLRFHEAMLIGELVPLAMQYLQDNPASEERNRYSHVLVDEYQDLNRAEQTVADLLASNGSLTVIGDEDQSIYSFKHAHPEGIVRFAEGRPGTHDESLDVCRRCPTSIVGMANHLIAHNEFRQPRELKCFEANPEGLVSIVQWRSMADEALGIVAYLQKKVFEDQVAAGDILVLAPNKIFGYRVRDLLNEHGIQAVSYFREEALDGLPRELARSQNQQALTLNSLLANPSDKVALRAWCGFGSGNLRAPAWRRLISWCSEHDVSPWVALEQIGDGAINIPYTGSIVSRFDELQLLLREFNGLTGEALTDALFPEEEEWAAPFRDVACSIEAEDFDPKKLDTELRTKIAQQEIPDSADFVRVMSLFKAKGLTANYVVILGCVEGLLPRVSDELGRREAQRELEEQRRVFYVGITRAREELVLSNVTSLPRADAHRMGAWVRGGNAEIASTISSRFIAELGPTRPAPTNGQQFLRNNGCEIP